MVVSARAFQGRFFTLGVSLAIVGILIFMLMERVDREIDNLEQTRFDFRLAELNAALRIKHLEIKAGGGRIKGQNLKGANPMDWIEAAPQGQPSQYLGVVELASLKPEEARGNWAYDPVQKVLAYLPRAPGSIRLSGSAAQKQAESVQQDRKWDWIKYQVRPKIRSGRLEALHLELVSGAS